MRKIDPHGDIKMVCALLREELDLGYKFKLEKAANPLEDLIWVRSKQLSTYMQVEEEQLWISDDCRKHLECPDNVPCETDFFTVKLADPKFPKHVGAILFELESRREAIATIYKDSFAIVDRDMRIEQLEDLLIKNKIRIPK